jgi:hypothetical protein
MVFKNCTFQVFNSWPPFNTLISFPLHICINFSLARAHGFVNIFLTLSVPFGPRFTYVPKCPMGPISTFYTEIHVYCEEPFTLRRENIHIVLQFICENPRDFLARAIFFANSRWEEQDKFIWCRMTRHDNYLCTRFSDGLIHNEFYACKWITSAIWGQSLKFETLLGP